MKKERLFLLMLFFCALVYAQTQMAQLKLMGEPQKSMDELVAKRDANGRVCAAIKVISDLGGFSYDSYNGVVAVDRKPGQDIVYLQPDERVLEIFHQGYQPLKLILSTYGIYLKSREMWIIKITGVGKAANTLPVTFLVKPEDAQIEVDGVPARHGKPIDLSPGQHLLKISKKGFRTLEKEISVDKNNVLFNFSLEEVELLPITIKSVPTGASIFINGVNQGQTDKGMWLYPGTYRLKLSLSGFAEIVKTITVRENQENVFAFTLPKNAGYLQLSVQPADAMIKINQQSYRTTDKITLPAGTYQLTISKNGYLDVNDQVQIKAGETVTRSYQLVKNTGILEISVQPEKSTVLINKADYSGKNRVELAPGVYKIEVLAKGYSPQKETITIERGQTLTRNYQLKRKVGALRFSVTPVFADVQLKKKGKVVKHWQGLKLIKNLPIGQYELQASAKGYSTERTIVTIAENKTIPVDLTLEKGVFFTGGYPKTDITGTLRLIVNPADARTTINGIPVSDHFFILPVGVYRIECQKSGFEKHGQSVNIQKDQELRVDVRLREKSMGKALTLSLIFPGWGQSYKESKIRGWLYRLAFVGSAVGAYYFTDQYNKSVKKYRSIREQYTAIKDYQQLSILGDKMIAQYKKVEDNEKFRNYFYAATAAVWLINVLDALFLPPSWKRSVKISFNSTPGGMALKFNF